MSTGIQSGCVLGSMEIVNIFEDVLSADLFSSVCQMGVNNKKLGIFAIHRGTEFPTRLHVRPANTKISLCIRESNQSLRRAPCGKLRI